MCGIVGFYQKTPLTDHDIEKGRQATASLSHRGPDVENVYWNREQGLFLGHRRLSIIGLDAYSNQPLERDGIVLTYNGELYNYKDIRQELIAKGYDFLGTSDTEVLVRAYQEWDTDCLERVDGMFAFALWDPKKGLWLARDPFGEKPLYWVYYNERFAFASELKALAFLTPLIPELDRNHIIEYYHEGFFRPPFTFYRDVYAVSPGHSDRIQMPQAPSFTPYWSPEDEQSQDVWALTFPQKIEEIHRLFSLSVKKRLEADVPIGLLLSGGIDSSLVAAVVQTIQPDVQCYSISFPSAREDESEFAANVTKHLHLPHKIIPCELTQAEEFIEESINLFDQPNGNYGILPFLFLCQHVAKDYKVVLSGNGGDELFYGYGRYPYIARYERFLSWPFSFRWCIARLAEKIWGHRRSASFSTLFSIRKLEDSYWAIKNHRYYQELFRNGSACCSNQPMERLIRDNAKPLWQIFRLYDLLFTQPDTILASTDRASMRFGLEVRTPFLQRDLFAMTEQIEARNHLRKNQPKYILRLLLNRYFPSHFFERPKQGFIPPINTWLRDGLLDERLQRDESGLYTPQTIQTLLQKHKSGENDYSPILYRVAAMNTYVSRGKIDKTG